MNAIQKIWHWIYPSDDEHKWFPVVWLPFMLYFFIDPIWWHHRTPLLVIGNTIFGLVFIWLYLYSFSHGEMHRLYAAVGLMVMAACLVPTNNGAASVLFVYAIAPGAFTTNRARLLAFTGISLGLMGLYAYHLKLPLAAWGSMMLLVVLVGIVNYLGAVAHCRGEKLRKADTEIEHLAKVAERERIARDLHDLLGHTLSLITLKAELARKLVDRDPQRAKQEMLEVEQTSRAALADVREAISGYRGEGLAAELVRARKTLETAGITVNSDIKELRLSPAQETVLALALREAVTNVVRHAEARQCSVRLLQQKDVCTLEIADNGRGANAPEGNGLRGMRERLEALGGSLECQTKAGTRLVIQLPLSQPIASIDDAMGAPIAHPTAPTDRTTDPPLAPAAPALRN